jgi:signal transduction histidine kinase
MSRSRTDDDVGAFLDTAHSSRELLETRLAQLQEQRSAAAVRLQGLRPRLATQTDVLDELLARDEELAAIDDELRAQIASLEAASDLLERERSKYLDFFVNAPDAYVVTDLSGTTQEANLRAAGLFNVAPQFLAGRPLVSFVSRQDTRLFRAILKDVEQADGAVRSATIRMRPRGQAPFVVAARVALVRSLAGRPIAVRWSLRQVDAGEVRQAAWLVDSELARLLQDLRRPLASIQTWVRALRDGEVHEEQERAQALAWIEKTAADELSLLDELQELGDLEVESQEKNVVDLLEQVRAVVAVIAPEMAPCRVPASPLCVRGDAALLRRALVVLLRRAAAAHPQGVPVPPIELSVSGGSAVVIVHANEEARLPPGWGVRLAIASRIAESHGGRLIVSQSHAAAELHLPLGSPESRVLPLHS